MDNPALIGAEGAGGLGAARGPHFVGQGARQFLQAGVLAGVIVSGVHLHAHLRAHGAGDHARGQILHGRQVLALTTDKQAGVFTIHAHLHAIFAHADLQGHFAHDGENQPRHHIRGNADQAILIQIGQSHAGQT